MKTMELENEWQKIYKINGYTFWERIDHETGEKVYNVTTDGEQPRTTGGYFDLDYLKRIKAAWNCCHDEHSPREACSKKQPFFPTSGEDLEIRQMQTHEILRDIEPLPVRTQIICEGCHAIASWEQCVCHPDGPVDLMYRLGREVIERLRKPEDDESPFNGQTIGWNNAIDAALAAYKEADK